MEGHERELLIKKVELFEGHRSEVLVDLGIPRSTYYKWRKAYDEDGVMGLEKTKTGAKKNLEPAS